MCEIHFTDVRRKQIDCLMYVLQTTGQQLLPDQWPSVITVVGAVVGSAQKCVFVFCGVIQSGHVFWILYLSVNDVSLIWGNFVNCIL